MKYILFALLIFIAGCSGDNEPLDSEDGAADMKTDSPDMAADAADPPETQADMATPAPQGPVETIISGERLKRRYFESADGTQNSGFLFDSQFNTYCRFAEVDDEFRCVPHFNSVVYSDQGCTQPIGRFRRTCDESNSKFFTDSENLYRATSAIEFIEGTRDVFVAGESGCQPRTLYEQSAQLRTLEQVQLTDFVAGELVVSERSDGLETRFIDGDDGSRQLVGTFNQSLGYRCRFSTGVCLPSGVPATRYFADSNCEVRLYGGSEGQRYGQLRDGDYCPERVTELKRHEGAVFVSDSDGCNEEDVDDVLYTPGIPVDEASLSEVVFRTEGEGRIDARHYVDSDGRPLTLIDLFDNELQQECAPGYVGDPDSFRCHPNKLVLFEQLFVDSSCSEQTEVVSPGLCDGVDPIVSSLDAGKIIDQCFPGTLPIEKTVRRGAPVSVYEENRFGACEGTDLEGFLVGEEVTDELADLNLKTEP